MRVPANFHWPDPPKAPEGLLEWAKDLNSALYQHLLTIQDVINGQMTLGDGIDPDNLAGQFKVVTTAGAGSETAVPHDLNQIPAGFILVRPPQSGSVNRGPTAWTTSQVFLSCSAASQSFTVFLLALPSK